MSGTEVTLVGVNAAAWCAGPVLENLQGWGARTSSGSTGAGALLLGVIEHVSGSGELFVGLGYKGIFSPSGTVTFFPGTEEDGIEANTCDEGSPPRVGQTPEATWSD